MMALLYFPTRKLNPASAPAATRSIMAASLAGSSAAFAPPAFAPGPGSVLESGRVPGPTPKAELSSTRVAISSGTPTLTEGCELCALSRPVSALELPFAAPFGCEPGPDSGDREEKRLIPELPGPGFPWLICPVRPVRPVCPTCPAPANSTPPNPGPPSVGIGRSAASPSGGKSAAKRIDLALQRMLVWCSASDG